MRISLRKVVKSRVLTAKENQLLECLDDDDDEDDDNDDDDDGGPHGAADDRLVSRKGDAASTILNIYSKASPTIFLPPNGPIYVPAYNHDLAMVIPSCYCRLVPIGHL